MLASVTDALNFISDQKALIELERDVEVRQTNLLSSNCSIKQLERSGLAFGSLDVVNRSIGFGDKTIIELQRSLAHHADRVLPSSEIRVGDLIKLTESATKPSKYKERHQNGTEAVVYKLTEHKLVLAVSESSPKGIDGELELPSRCNVVKLANLGTYDRILRNYDSLAKSLLKREEVRRHASTADDDAARPVYDSVIPLQRSEAQMVDNGVQPACLEPAIGADSDRKARLDETSASLSLSQILLGMQEISEPQQKSDVTILDDALNQSQQDAVKFALHAREVALIHGPPGTGKTSTLIEIIRQLVRLGQRVLVCGASNLAVDNIVERLQVHSVPLTRLGHPARILEATQRSTLDYQTAHSANGALAQDVRDDIAKIFADLAKGKLQGKGRRAKLDEIKLLRKELRVREAGVTSSVIGQARVVLCTCHGAGSKQIMRDTFDVAIIDEAAQALEGSCWIPILKAQKLVLAGDPLQLPPTIKTSDKDFKQAKVSLASISKSSKLCSARNLETTLFDRLLAMYGAKIKCLLSIQYRMNERIMRFASDALYEGKLVAALQVKDRLLCDLVETKGDDVLDHPVIFIDTTGNDMYERADEETGVRTLSKYNENEAVQVVKHISEIVSAGLPPKCIAVISPYNAQVSLLRSLLVHLPDISVGSIDSWQGREAECIIISLVRSNDQREVGFLKESRRLNVAMTRAKRQLCVVGDAGTVRTGSSYLERWMTWLEDESDYRLVL
ncbi:hypothetical protein E5Q_03757 [Mixia osmundae IAM 14324]|uniref:DNA helicase n=1 Tax=Mixia osmundae (strain CBS 9802 / IAM 14324 / JCM 22182 / KY 12970) TaxID=764103 RepID=G7E2M2_MIXOS|nr:hypothetical protein E5Q_03757 [Mixia osmundae IAM 14324]